MMEQSDTHWATITWNGIGELAERTFCEVVSAWTEEDAVHGARMWASANISDEVGRVSVKYTGSTAGGDARGHDPRLRVQVNQSSAQIQGA